MSEDLDRADVGLRVLVVDDEPPARDELAWLLRQDPRIGEIHVAADAAEALRAWDSVKPEAVFCDIQMPGLSGMDLARVLRRFACPPALVFVTAHEEHALAAFDLHTVDYLLKPVRAERLSEAVGRVLSQRDVRGGGPLAADLGAVIDLSATAAPTTAGVPAPGKPAAPRAAQADGGAAELDGDEKIAFELGGVTRFVWRSDVRFVEAHGDYARLVTDHGRHLVRIPLSVLEERWSAHGFVRIHRRHLVALALVHEVRVAGGRMTVRIGDEELEVSRRHSRELRERLLSAPRSNGQPR